MIRLRWALALTLFGLLTGCSQESGDGQEPPPFDPEGVLAFERPDGTRITAIAIEVAESDSAKERGLMERRSMPARGGMFFPYKDAAPRTFWMANTYIPLDIIFVGPDSQVVNIAKGTRPLSEQQVSSDAPAQYVVEVRAGFTGRHGITDSTRIDWRIQE